MGTRGGGGHEAQEADHPRRSPHGAGPDDYRCAVVLPFRLCSVSASVEFRVLTYGRAGHNEGTGRQTGSAVCHAIYHVHTVALT